MKTTTAGKIVRASIAAASWYFLVASIILLTADLWLMLRAGGVAKISPAELALLPVEVLRTPLNPAQAFEPYTALLELPLRLSALAGIACFVWVTLLRHGYANPINAMRSEYELPLSRQLKPKLRDLGLWVQHDAARADPKASVRDKVLVKLVRTFRPHADLARAVTHRGNGILVPYQGPQPEARILLGNYRHLHLVRRKKYNVYARPEQHVVIFGPSGAGKGATQMVPSLLFWNGDDSNSPDGHGKGWPGAIITSTVKSDHVDAALEWRQSISSECYIYDPLQSYPEYRDYWVGWDPLVTIRNFSDANSVAAALMESESQQAGGGGGNEEYFKAQALMVLSPMLLSAALKKLPFRSVYDWALKLENEAADPAVISPEGDVSPDSRTYAVMDPLYDYAESTGDDTPLNQMQQIFAKDPREASGVWGTIRKILQPYNDEKSVMSTDPAFMPRMLDPKAFYSTPHSTLFIIAPEVANEAKRMRPVFAAFITWLIEEAQKLARENNGKLPRPVLANLDEVKNVGAIPGLAHTLSLTRSIGFFVKHAWQDEAQIASAYGKDDAKTITSNSRTWVILPGISDPEHLEALARLIGERPVKKRKTKVDPNNPDENSRLKAATASMVKELKDNELLILTDNLPPFVINASRYFQDKVMLARHKLGDGRRSGEPIVRPEKATGSNTGVGQKTDTLPALGGPQLATELQARMEGTHTSTERQGYTEEHSAAPPMPPMPAAPIPMPPAMPAGPSAAGGGSIADTARAALTGGHASPDHPGQQARPPWEGEGEGTEVAILSRPQGSPEQQVAADSHTPYPPTHTRPENPSSSSALDQVNTQANWQAHRLGDTAGLPGWPDEQDPREPAGRQEPGRTPHHLPEHPSAPPWESGWAEPLMPQNTDATRAEAEREPLGNHAATSTATPNSNSPVSEGPAYDFPPLPSAEPAAGSAAARDSGGAAYGTGSPKPATTGTLFGAPLGAPERASPPDLPVDETNEAAKRDDDQKQHLTTQPEKETENPATLGSLFGDGSQEHSGTQQETTHSAGAQLPPTREVQHACAECGTQFNLEGLDATQRQAVWDRHQRALHSPKPAVTPAQDAPATLPEPADERKEPATDIGGASIASNGWRTPEP